MNIGNFRGKTFNFQDFQNKNVKLREFSDNRGNNEKKSLIFLRIFSSPQNFFFSAKLSADYQELSCLHFRNFLERTCSSRNLLTAVGYRKFSGNNSNLLEFLVVKPFTIGSFQRKLVTLWKISGKYCEYWDVSRKKLLISRTKPLNYANFRRKMALSKANCRQFIYVTTTATASAFPNCNNFVGSSIMLRILAGTTRFLVTYSHFHELFPNFK